jgi:hypothetical protein
MKNIHALPTDKPSRLGIHKDDRFYLHDSSLTKNLPHFHPQNIYIVSDEEIKEGDWVLLDNSIKELPDYQGLHVIQILDRVLLKSATALQCKKIILTTDFDLIFNGVQPIDDEFLEWFVKNPSCEFVKTELIGYASGYNLDIPQEEPLPYQLKGVLDTMSQEEFDKEWKKVTGLKMESPSMFEEPKQETLEEAAVNYSKIFSLEGGHRGYAGQGFIDGAKWQAGRMYSAEDLRQAFLDGELNIEYSEVHGLESRLSQQKWFDQFKKK